LVHGVVGPRQQRVRGAISYRLIASDTNTYADFQT
jgi:hypothetical protein